MKLSDLDSRELANKGAKCRLYNPKTGEQTGASITMLGADSTVYKAKTKEIAERRRLEGKTMTQEQAEEDSREILAACATGWAVCSCSPPCRHSLLPCSASGRRR